MRRNLENERLKDQIGRLTIKIDQLESELNWTRRHLIDVMPPSINEALEKWMRSKTSDESFVCEIETVQTIIASAEPNPEFNNWSHEKRAACPLCKDTGSHWSYGADGFSLPEGLRRHLEGKSGAHKCSVMGMLQDMSKEECQIAKRRAARTAS